MMMSCLLLGLPGDLRAATETLLLDVRLNGHAVGKIGEFTLVDGVLFSQRSELRELGLKMPDRPAANPDDRIALTALPGLTYHLDVAAQTIALDVSNDHVVPTLLFPDGGSRAGGSARTSRSQDGAAVESGIGASLDYDIAATSVNGHLLGAGLLDLRVFSPFGTASTAVLTDVSGRGISSIVRLDTSYTFSDPASLRRVRVGDFISGGLAWTRPVRLGGVQVSLDFGLRPDLITFPLPSVSGSTAVPSTVDVLVNGTKLFSRDIEAGPFEVPQLPVVTGAGTVSTTLTNALGRQVTTTLPFYASSALLAPGLQTYSLQAGAVRRNFGLRSNDYRSFAGSAIYRRGLSDVLTIETTTEVTRNLAMAGAGAVLNLDNLAVLNASVAVSTNQSRIGNQLSIGLQRLGDRLSLSAAVTIADTHFRDLAAVTGDPIPRRQINVSAGWTFGRFGSVGLAYVGIDRDAAPNQDVVIGPPNIGPPNIGDGGAGTPVSGNGLVYLQPAQKAHILTTSYSAQFGRVSVFVTGFRDLGSGGSGVLAGLAIPFGRRASAAINVGSGTNGTTGQVQAAQAVADIGDWGYQVAAGTGSPGHEFAEVEYKSAWSQLSAGIDHTGSTTTLRAGAQGSLSLLAGSVWASNTIRDSFAVVDTDGLAHVRVRSENRDVGTTNSRGLLLVPDLRSFEVNHLSIDPSDVPLDATLATSIRDVRPQDRSGIVVRFRVDVSAAALLRLVDKDGAPIPLGSTARLTATGEMVPVGYDGQAYLTGLSRRNEVDVEASDGRHCTARFAYSAKAGDIPVLGPVPCIEAGR